jgi:hypothetical protein
MRPSALALPTALLLAVVAAGCDKPITSICRQICECSPCTDNDFDNCVTLAQDAETKAQKKGASCSAKFDTFLTCFDDNLSCQMGAGAGTSKCAAQEAATISGACTGVNLCDAVCILATSCDVLNNMTFSQTFQECTNACVNNNSTSSGVTGGGPVP